MTISFRMVRNLGLLTMVAVIAMIGAFSFTSSTKIVRSLSVILKEKRPLLEKLDSIRQDFLDARDAVVAFSREGKGDIASAVASMDNAIGKSTAIKNVVAEKDKREVEKFILAAKRFKMAISTYAKELKVDPTGSSAIAMEQLALATTKEASDALGEMVSDIRANIRASDTNAFLVAKKSQNLILVGVLAGGAVGLLTAFFMGRGLSRPVRQLVDGTQRMAKGDLDYRIKMKPRDEIGRLADAFNKMAQDLGVAIQKERELAVAAERAADTEKKKAAELDRVNRALRMISDCNQVMVRVSEERELLQSICQVIADKGGYCFSWVGFAQNDADKTVRPVAYAGQENGYLSTTKITWADDEFGRGPTGTAIRTGLPCVVRDIPTDPQYAPWRRQAMERGYGSSIALPLIIEGQPAGALHIYSQEKDTFDEEEIDLLKELAVDLSYGLMALRMRDQRQRAEDALQESEKRYQALMDNSILGIAVLDTDYKIIMVNSTFARLFKKPVSDFVGKYCFREFEKREAVCAHCPGTRAMASGKTEEVETQGVRDDGSRFWVRNRAVPFFNSDGTLEGFIEMVEDIDERKRAEEKYRTILRTAIDGFWITDMQGRFLDVNDAYCRLIGYSRDELLKMGIPDIEAAEGPEETAQRIQKITAVGGDRFESQHRHKDGKIVDIEVSVNYTKEEGGRLFVFLRDVSERKRAEKELQSAYEQLKATQDQLLQSAKMASLGQLAGGVAHEVNNPLSGVLNNVQLFKMMLESGKTFDDKQLRELCTVIESSALRCKSIIKSLLDFSRAAKGVFEPLQLNILLSQVVGIVDKEMQLENIAIQKEYQPELPDIQGDPQLLQQVVLGLLVNAKWAIDRRHDKAARLIILRTWSKPNEDTVCLSVSDNGIGIPQENLSCIFEPFFTTKDVGEGTGLGLALIYKIIESHNAAIKVESQVGAGSTFTMSFPVGR